MLGFKLATNKHKYELVYVEVNLKKLLKLHIGEISHFIDVYIYERLISWVCPKGYMILGKGDNAPP